MVYIIETMNDTDYFAKYDNAYLERYDELFMLMYVYLHRHRSIEGYVNMTVKDFLLYYNYKPNRGRGRINSKVFGILGLMEKNGFIKYIGCYSDSITVSMDNVDCDVMFAVQVINFDANWNPENNFTKILYAEIDSLRGNNIEHMGKALILYINIKKHISGDTGNPSAILFAYPSESTLSKKCNYGISTVKKYTKILCDIKMLYIKNYGSYRRMLKGKETIENSNNVYALEKKYLDDNARESLKKYLKANYGYIDGFYPFCNNLPDDMAYERSDPRDCDVPTSRDTEDDDFTIEEAEELFGTPIQNDSVLEPEKSTESEDDFIDIDTFPW